MHSKFVKLGFLFLAGALISIGAAAHAANINTSGVICQNYNASQALDIDYLPIGVRNLNAASRPVICAVPRSPLAAGATPLFYVDGHNNANTTTFCTLTIYTFLGAYHNSVSFMRTGGATGLDWDQAVTFPVGGVGYYDYASLLCTLPGSAAGLIYGVTSVQ